MSEDNNNASVDWRQELRSLVEQLRTTPQSAGNPDSTKETPMRNALVVLGDLEEKIKLINVSEIADHLNEEALFNWCGAWREDALSLTKELKDFLEIGG
jgi:hypothetical protein